MNLVPLAPFGVRVDVPADTPFEALDVARLKALVREHRVVQLRGLRFQEPHELARASRRLGPLQPWPFGAVHELKVKENADNYLYTDREVPLHWDGAFAAEVPHYLVFECVVAPPEGQGGETVFVDTVRALEAATPEQKCRWEALRVRYRTQRIAHYGGAFEAQLLATHSETGEPTMRFAQPVDDLNPLSVQPLGHSPAMSNALIEELTALLNLPAHALALALAWRAGDVVIADNHALLHGRRAFNALAPRHIYRVNVLGQQRPWNAKLRAAWAVRRPEFLRAEIPILGIPALLCATHASELFSCHFAAMVLAFFLFFNMGDLCNCLLDRDLDLHRKTHLAEAVHLLGRRSIVWQIALSTLLGVGLAVHLAVQLARPWIIGAALLGSFLAVQYTAPHCASRAAGSGSYLHTSRFSS